MNAGAQWEIRGDAAAVVRRHQARMGGRDKPGHDVSEGNDRVTSLGLTHLFISLDVR
jgi:hypothetical protein